MGLVVTYAVGRLVFGAAALAAPRALGHALGGPAAAAPDAQAFLRGIGGREIALGAGLLRAARSGEPVGPWLVAGVLADAGDLAGLAGEWERLDPAKRVPGAAAAATAGAAGLVVLAKTRKD